MFTTISTTNSLILQRHIPVDISTKYPIHTYAALTKVNTAFTQTINTDGFVQYTNSTNSSYLSLNQLVSNNAYFDSKKITMYFAFKVNTYEVNKGVLGFCGTLGSNNGYIFHMTMTSSTGIAFDWQVAGAQYGLNTNNNSNYPTFPYAVGSTCHLFMTFDRPTSKYNFYIYNNSGAQQFSFLNRTYPATPFASNYAAGQKYSLFSLGNNAYGAGGSAKQTVVFFNLFESILTTTQMEVMVTDTR